MPKYIPMPDGSQWGRLTVLRPAGRIYGNARAVECQCSCGARSVVAATLLRTGRVKSCGCLIADRTVERNKTTLSTHGHYRGGSASLTYKSWCGMKARCKRKPGYADRGIQVCARWTDFVAFLADMGERPSPDHTIDRVNNDGHYEPGNCRWVDRSAQASNRRPRQYRPQISRLTPDQAREIRATYAAGGVTMRALAERFGVTTMAVHALIHRRTWKHA